jgi:asparagine synthase (glutamine-hydrolysing)
MITGPYLALVWQKENDLAVRQAARVRCLLDRATNASKSVISAPGLSVYAGAPPGFRFATYALPGDAGVIVGQLFTSEPPYRLLKDSDLTVSESREATRKWLLKDHWGDYVAIIRSRGGDECEVLRSCSGQVPCFYTAFDSLHIFFSDIRDLECLNFRFTLNDRYLTAFIARPPLHVRATGLNEVREVLAGEGAIVSAAGLAHSAIWNPRVIVNTDVIDTYEQAKSRLVAITEGVISAWASLSRRILLTLSGGLDSAIVLGCLHKMGFAERVVCVTHFTDSTAGDERLYARSAAHMARVPLLEIPRISDGRTFVEKLSAIPADPKPAISKMSRMLAIGELNRIAEEFACDSVWTGEGGDHLFLQDHHPYSAADYLVAHTFSVRFPSIVHDSALLSRDSVWSVLSRALYYKLHPGASPPATFGGAGHRFLLQPMDSDWADGSSAYPWREGKERVVPGKQLQLDPLSDLLNRHKPLLGLEIPVEHHPLVSQPLIEASLQIPTYHLLRGGRQRAMARDAFSDRVPVCILKREDKGNILDQDRAILRESAPFLRERLLDGVLASRGILNRAALEQFFLHQETFTLDELFPLFACIAAENWAQHWACGKADGAGGAGLLQSGTV